MAGALRFGRRYHGSYIRLHPNFLKRNCLKFRLRCRFGDDEHAQLIPHLYIKDLDGLCMANITFFQDALIANDLRGILRKQGMSKPPWWRWRMGLYQLHFWLVFSCFKVWIYFSQSEDEEKKVSPMRKPFNTGFGHYKPSVTQQLEFVTFVAFHLGCASSSVTFVRENLSQFRLCSR